MKATISALITAAALSILTSNTGDLFAQSINIQSLSTKSGQKIADVSQVGTIQDSVELMRQAGSSGFMGISTANSNQNPLGATVTALPCRQ